MIVDKAEMKAILDSTQSLRQLIISIIIFLLPNTDPLGTLTQNQ